MARGSDLSRRQFLARSAGYASASLGIHVCTAGASKRSEKTHPGEIRLALIGLGDRGTQLLGTVLRNPLARIAGLCDVDPSRLKRAEDLARGHRPRSTKDLGTLLSMSGLDAVIVATPVYLHREHALAALVAGKHVYLEKPMGLTAADCREVYRSAEEAWERGQIFQIGLQRRYSPRYQASIALIHEGRAGRVLFIKAQWHSTGSPARGSKPWYFQREKSGDIVLEQACHQMDVFNWVFRSEPLVACGLGGTHFPEGPGIRNIRDHYGVTLSYEGGGVVNLSHLSYAIPDRRFAGVYEIVIGEKLGIDLGNAVLWDRSGKAAEIPSTGGNDTGLALDGFLHSIRTGERPKADARAGLNATLASLLALRALDTGRTASWSEII